MRDLDRDVAEALVGATRAAPISRAALAAQCGSDRAVRAAIARLRMAGWPIVAAATGGYFIAQEAQDLRRQHRQHVRRIIALARAARRIERMLAELPPLGQQVLRLLDEEES